MGALDKASTSKMLANMMALTMQQEQQEKIISEMHVRHVLNVLWYIASVLVLLHMRYIVFKGYPLMAFVAAIIFTTHPIHTEVVANVKSRDEIMSVLFICLTFIYTFKYQEFGKNTAKPNRISILCSKHPQPPRRLASKFYESILHSILD
jgi:hypothetical protein